MKRLTGVCETVVMDEWMDEFVKILEDNGLTIFCICNYVDDILFLFLNVKLDAIWQETIFDTAQNSKKYTFLKNGQMRYFICIFIRLPDSLVVFFKLNGETSIDGTPTAHLDCQIRGWEPSSDSK